jgi:hypothetical protein
LQYLARTLYVATSKTELGLRSTARTSEEFLHSLKGNVQLDESFQSTLREVLANLDHVKFAQQAMSIKARIHITDTIRKLIDQAHATSQKEGIRP